MVSLGRDNCGNGRAAWLTRENGEGEALTKASPCHMNSERLDRPSDLRSLIVVQCRPVQRDST